MNVSEAAEFGVCWRGVGPPPRLEGDMIAKRWNQKGPAR